MLASCFFCDRLRVSADLPGGILLDDAFFQATLWTETAGPSYRGQVLIQTRRHVPSLAELTPAEGAALGPVIQRLAVALRVVVHPELVYLDCYMEVVRHVHFFLTPRYFGTPPEFWRLEVTYWPGAPRVASTGLGPLGDELRAALRAPE